MCLSNVYILIIRTIPIRNDDNTVYSCIYLVYYVRYLKGRIFPGAF